MQTSVHQCISYLCSEGRKPHEPTGLHALHAPRKVAVFSGGPHLKMTEESVECWIFTDEWENCLDYHILS